MSNGLARAAVRFRPASFAGTFLALLFASAIVTACGVLLQTGLTASVQPSRYADVPVVVAADQQVKVEVARGEDRETVAQPLPERARLDAALTTTVASLPGVAQALPDSAFPVSVASAPSSSSASSAGSTSAPSDLPGLTGRGWAALGIGPGERLAEGRAPADGELVLDAASARAAHLSPGDSVTVATPASTAPPTGSPAWPRHGPARPPPGSPTAPRTGSPGTPAGSTPSRYGPPRAPIRAPWPPNCATRWTVGPRCRPVCSAARSSSRRCTRRGRC